MNIINTESVKLEPIAVGEDGLFALLGGVRISAVTLWRWEKAGLIDRVPGISQRLWTVASIRRMVAGKSATRNESA
jgi:hypothetical protein